MLKRTLSAALLALGMSAGLLLTPNEADAQRWRQNLPFRGYFVDQFLGTDPYYGDWRYYNNYPGYYTDYRYYDNRWMPGQSYSGYGQRYWDPYYGRYYYWDPYTGQSYWY